MDFPSPNLLFSHPVIGSSITPPIGAKSKAKPSSASPIPSKDLAVGIRVTQLPNKKLLMKKVKPMDLTFWFKKKLCK